MNYGWKQLLKAILTDGALISPRGQATKELLHRTVLVDMTRPVLTVKERKLSYSGMAAEAYWICRGDNTLAGIEPWLPKMAQFSDDGVILAGAYGPRIHDQLDYVVGKLGSDADTRQATLALWSPNPEPSKDYPCTCVMDFKLRNGKLNMHVFMRSSDAWLGIPYDVFSFSMVAHLVCCRLNGGLGSLDPVTPGKLFLTAASSHLYEPNWLEALRCVSTASDDVTYETPAFMYTDEARLLFRLEALRSTKPGDRLRWWETGQ